MTNVMSNSKPIPKHSYSVEIRFYGEGLNPLEISQKIGLNATNDLSGIRGRKYWAYNGQDEEGFCQEWESLESGLLFLVSRLSSRRSVILNLSKIHDGIWWCGHFQTSFDGGPTLSPAVLADVASFGLPLFIDNYFSSES